MNMDLRVVRYKTALHIQKEKVEILIKNPLKKKGEIILTII